MEKSNMEKKVIWKMIWGKSNIEKLLWKKLIWKKLKWKKQYGK